MGSAALVQAVRNRRIGDRMRSLERETPVEVKGELFARETKADAERCSHRVARRLVCPPLEMRKALASETGARGKSLLRQTERASKSAHASPDDPSKRGDCHA